MTDRYANLGETPEWNDAENRKQEAIRRLRIHARHHPDYTITCLTQVMKLESQPHWMWPLGTRP